MELDDSSRNGGRGMINTDEYEQRLREVQPFNHLAWELIQEIKRLLSTLNEVRDILLNDDKGCEDSPSHYALLTINEVIE